MDDQFRPDERLFRAVMPREELWKASGVPSSAVFKDSKGVSVDRDGGRSSEETADFLLLHHKGAAVYVTYAACEDCMALVRYCPTDENIWHSEIYRSDKSPQLSRSQARYLALHAVVFRR